MLRNLDHMCVCIMCNTDAEALLSNIIVLLTGLRNKLSAKLKIDSHKTGRQTRTRNESKRGILTGLLSMEYTIALVMTC